MQPARDENDQSAYFDAAEKRKHPRFRSSAFSGVPLKLKPAPPFFGAPIDGKLLDLSGGGMAIIIREALPVQTKMKLELTFPGHAPMACLVQVRRVITLEDGYFQTGMQFLNLPEEMAAEIDRMSQDCGACDRRIWANEATICDAGCAFMNLCDKAQRVAAPGSQKGTIGIGLKPAE